MIQLTKKELDEACINFWYYNLVEMRPPSTIQYYASYKVYLPQEAPDTGCLSSFHYRYLIGSDPDDTLTLQIEGGIPETFRMHSTAWRWSLDYLLYRYLTLALREDGGTTITLPVPDMILKRYDNYMNQSNARKKPLSIAPPAYLPKPSKRKHLVKQDGYTHFHVPHFGEPSYLNLFCHDIFTQPNNPEWLNNPRRDAIFYTNKNMNTLPVFQLEDFIAHELKTGISLSTEITAIVLELDEAIREVALEAFYTRALNDLIRIPFPFTRNTAARNFFQQISSEWAREKYTWSTSSTRGREAKILMDSFRLARLHVDLMLQAAIQPIKEGPFQAVIHSEEELQKILQEEKAQNEDPTRPRKYRIERDPATEQIKHVYEYPLAHLPEFPNTKDPAQMDAYMEQIDAYLQAIRTPFDWAFIKDQLLKKHMPAHLAVFTNRKHRYIPLLLRYLENEKMTMHFGNEVLPITVNECKKLYSAIHMKVRSASMKTYADMNWIKEYMDRE